MEMSRTLAGVLAGCLVLIMATVAGAGIPDADLSSVSMTAGGKGLATCPAGDAASYSYITVTALRTDSSPIQGIPSGSFFFNVVGTGSGNVSISAFDTQTDVNGQCRFQANGDGAVLYGSLTVTVQIYTVVINDSDALWCNTFDYDDNGSVNPVDFGTFAGDFGGTNERSDFDWNGLVNPVDFGTFAGHFGH
jgi:hypothetical protein